MTDYFHSNIADSRAISDRLGQWRDAFPSAGVLALVAEREVDGVPQLQALCRERDMPLLGAVFPEVHVDGRFHRDGVLLILLNPMAGFHRIVEFNPDGSGAMAQVEALAAHLRGRLNSDTPSTLLMLFDALVPNIGSILEALYLQLAESVHYVGSNAGSESFQPMPCLFDSDRLVGQGLLVVLLAEHEGAVLEHGYQPPDRLIAATSTEGNRINSIGWQPAFDVYRKQIRQYFGIEVNRDNFYDYAVHFPFGIIRADNEVLVRIPVSIEEDGSLFCIGEVPEHSVLTLLEAPAKNALQTARQLAERLDDSSKCVLNFYCAGRRMHLGKEAAVEELHSLQQAIGSSPVFGALSLGEIGSSHRGGYPLFHNAALICMPL